MISLCLAFRFPLPLPPAGSLSTGALVGIVVGSCVFAALLSALLMWLLRPQQKRSKFGLLCHCLAVMRVMLPL